ncbi:MAG: hypothetical protein AAB671_02040 [Patescibacteria group bacterium]
MQAKVVHQNGAYYLAFSSGASVALDSSAVPKALEGGGDCMFVLLPAGEIAPAAQARELLNQLLHAS